jgi:Rhodanese-like domain
MVILAIGGLLVAGLVVWALTRTVQPTPETSAEAIPTASAPLGVEPTNAPNPALPVPDTALGSPSPTQTSTYAPNPPTADENASVARIAVGDLKSKIDAKQVVVVDVRDKTSYATAHIPGALHMPMATVESQVESLPKDRPIVTYCT